MEIIYNLNNIEGLHLLKPKIFYDDRGYFFEDYNSYIFQELGININFVQDNQSYSKKGVLRGLHYQKQYPQSKLVKVIKGSVYDVAIDLRKNSETYGKYYGIILSEENHYHFLIPKGFAHGFLVLSDYAIFQYKCDDFYHPNDESGIIYNDPTINIKWPFINSIILSEKDKNWKTLKEIEDIK